MEIISYTFIQNFYKKNVPTQIIIEYVHRTHCLNAERITIIIINSQN